MQTVHELCKVFSKIDEKQLSAAFKQYMYQNHTRSVINVDQLDMLKKIQWQAAKELDEIIIQILQEKQTQILQGVDEIIDRYDRVLIVTNNENPSHITMRDLEDKIRDKIKFNMQTINNDIVDVLFTYSWDYRLIGDVSTKRVKINNFQLFWKDGHINAIITFRDWKRYNNELHD